MAVSFSLLDIQALAPGLDSGERWQQWSEDLLWPETASLPATPLIPAMTARRMSQSARLAVQLGLQLIAQWQPRHLLCVSRHGELARTFTLLQKLIQQQPLSPTDFSMSVHNTVAGLTTIVGQQPLPASSLAAGVDSFHAGLVEACATLQAVSGPVLLLYFEGSLPEFYRPWVAECEPPHAVAVVLAPGSQWRYLGRE
ncbi:MAG: beta-ketoacyl synthase chain length factor, partial [Aeromonadaceae bacterium]|nr:beta-ketoacyl synthase chain length factor [Aeromonadaceae bacterium]